MRSYARFLLTLWVTLSASLPAWPMSVTFVNPGQSDEAYWVSASEAMRAAARSLGVDLEIIYLERQTPKAIEVVREIAARPRQRQPDYVILGNEGGVAPLALAILDAARIKVFLAFSGIDPDRDRAQTGFPRQKYTHWLGSLEPRAEDAGYLTAKALIDKGRAARLTDKDGKLHLLAISGDRTTPTSRKRSEGMRRALAEAGDAELDQEVFGAFSRAKAGEQSAWLFKRFPEARLLWAGSDQMALGALQTWESQGGKAGKDMLFSGINTSSEAFGALNSGRLTALAGGHFILGAWALIMLYDYHQGIDFAATEGLEPERPMFILFTDKDSETFAHRFARDDFSSIDFRRFSKFLNPQLKRYNFSFKQLLGESNTCPESKC